MCLRFPGEPSSLWMLVARRGVSHVGSDGGGGGGEQHVSPCCCLAEGLHAGVSEKQRAGLLRSKHCVCGGEGGEGDAVVEHGGDAL